MSYSQLNNQHSDVKSQYKPLIDSMTVHIRSSHKAEVLSRLVFFNQSHDSWEINIVIPHTNLIDIKLVIKDAGGKTKSLLMDLTKVTNPQSLDGGKLLLFTGKYSN